MTLKELYARMAQVIEMYGGKAPKTSSPKSLDLMSDYLRAIDAELDFKVRVRIAPDAPTETISE